MNFLHRHHLLRHDLRFFFMLLFFIPGYNGRNVSGWGAISKIRRGPAALKENAQEERRSVAGRRKGSERRDGSTRPRWPQV
ncbi:hypothetical protein EV122DRAFT_265756 [Schizophyllum commune]